MAGGEDVGKPTFGSAEGKISYNDTPPHPPAYVQTCPNCGRDVKWVVILADNGIDEAWVSGEMAECKHCRLEMWWHAPPGWGR